jgi:hypothetical protein
VDAIFLKFATDLVTVSKPKKYILPNDQVYDFEMIGICSHHNDYRLAWSLNEKLGIHLSKSEEDYLVAGKKGSPASHHSKYFYKDPENLIEFYLIKNKSLGKFLIPEKPTIDYFLFLYENHLLDPDDLVESLRDVSSVLGAYVFEPREIDSTENIIFN